MTDKKLIKKMGEMIDDLHYEWVGEYIAEKLLALIREAGWKSGEEVIEERIIAFDKGMNAIGH